MKYKLNIKATDFNSQPFKTNDGKTDATIADLVIGALLTWEKDQQEITGNERYKRYKLAETIKISQVRTGGTVELNEENLNRIKSCIDFCYPPLMLGRCYEVLNLKGEISPQVMKRLENSN